MTRRRFSERAYLARTCSVDGCAKPHLARGYCSAHYCKWKKYGDPLAGATTRLEWITRHSRWASGECLRWPFSDSDWYHAIRLPSGKYTKAHRLMCEVAHGAPDAGMHALHSCGNKWCVNPNHLRWGSPAENVADAIRDGAMATGEAATNAKLTEDDVRNARRDREGGMTYDHLAKKYGIAKGAIWHAVRGSQWGRVK